MLRILAITSLTLGCCIAFGQPPAARPAPTFEVATIKRSDSKEMRMMIRPQGDRLTVMNVPLQLLLTLAYQIKNFQVSGAPSWFQSERYDVEAKADRKLGRDNISPLVQTLLEDRLQLKFHRETKQGDVYALVVSKAEKLKEAEGECGPPPKDVPPPEPGKIPKAFCGGFFISPGHISAEKVPIAQIIDPLSNFTGRIVVDKTGLKGKYDIDLQYTPDPGQFGAPFGPAPPGALPPGGAAPFPLPDPNGPSLFTALQEQLGLKLESQKGPVEMFVIDHVERPSEN